MEKEKLIFIIKKIKDKKYFLIKIIFFFLLPFLFSLIIMKPTESFTIIIPNKPNEALVNLNIQNTTFSDGWSTLTGTPIKLNWFKFCLKNKNILQINDQPIKPPYKSDPESGAMEINFNMQNGITKKLYAAIDKEKCEIIKVENSIVSSTIIFRLPEILVPQPIEVTTGTFKLQGTAYIDSSQSSFTIQKSFSEFIFKCLSLIFFWNAFWITIKESYKICKNEKI